MSRQIIRIAFAIVLSMLVSVSADAQLNLKNIANKAAGQLKNAVEEKADKAAKSAKETAKETVTQTATQAVAPVVEAVAEEEENEVEKRFREEYGFNPLRIYTPGDELKSAVPSAGSDQVWEGFTRTESQICGAYENLPEKSFVLLPVALCKDYYYFGEGSRIEAYFDNYYKLMFHRFLTGRFGKINDASFVVIPTLPNGRGGNLQAWETAGSYFGALFAADPYSSVAFGKWMLAYMFDDNPSFMNHDIVMDSPDNRVINSKEGKMAAYSPNEITTVRINRGWLTAAIAKEITPKEVIKGYMQETYAKIDAAISEGNSMDALMNIYLFNTAWDKIAQERDDLKNDNDLLLSKTRVGQIDMNELKENYFAEHAEPVDLPAAGHMDAAATNALNEKAKKVFGDRVVKAYFTVSDWHVFKHDTYPYSIMGRSADCVVIVKDNDKYYMYYRTLTQGYNGSSFTSDSALQAGTFTGKVPVNYK